MNLSDPIARACLAVACAEAHMADAIAKASETELGHAKTQLERLRSETAIEITAGPDINGQNKAMYIAAARAIELLDSARDRR